MFLAINLGLIIAVTIPILYEWRTRATQLWRVDLTPTSWILTALGALAAFWSLRDLLAWRRLGRARFSSFE